MTHQEKMPECDPIVEWYESCGRPSPFKGEPLLPMNWADMRDQFGRTMDQIEFATTNPWASGRYAFAAIAWGLIALLVLGLGAGP